MRSSILAVVVVVLVGCGKASGPSATDCSAFLDHGIRLEEAGSEDKMPLFKYGDAGGRANFLKGCQKMVSRAQIDCAVKATDLSGFDKCIDRDALDDRMEAAGISDR